jgi:hypothetical protein
MKDQYFGDVNDYRKYGLLRGLTRSNILRLGVCWMLTPPDGRADGGHLAYLENPGKFSRFDPALFTWLTTVVRDEKDRRTARLEASPILGAAGFHSPILRDNKWEREIWFSTGMNALSGCDLVFFDPDNGIERSIRYGARDSCKFIYWHEIRESFSMGASVLIYQHFPRENRNAFTSRLAAQLRLETGTNIVVSFRTPHVVFLLAVQAKHLLAVHSGVTDISDNWPSDQIMCTVHG